MSRTPDPAPDSIARRLGRYELFERIASGGMAAVYLGRALGSGGFERIVAIKMCHEHLRDNEDFVKMFLDEARLAAKIHHPNVVPTLDASDQDGLYLVMDFVEGGPLLSVIRAALQHGEPVPAPISLRIITDTLSGLHAAHELTDGAGSPYNIVHRDVSPPNILVGLDGITRIADFGVAKAAARATETRDGQLKGKIPYMAPEQFEGIATRQTDVFSAGVVLWETLVGKRLFNGKNDVETMRNVLMTTPAAPSTVWPGVPEALDPVILRALHKDPAQRYPTAAAFADALEATGVPIASTRAVTAYLTKMLGPEIETRRGHYRQFMKADVVLATPAPSSGVTQRKMSEALADLQSSPGFSAPSAPPSNPSPGAANVKPPAEAAAPEKASVPRPGGLRAPTKPPLPSPALSASAPVAEKPAPAAAKPPVSATASSASAPSSPKPATAPVTSSTTASAPTATAKPTPASTPVAETKPASGTASAGVPKANTLPGASAGLAKPGSSSSLPARTAKQTLIGFADAPPASKPGAAPGAISGQPNVPSPPAEKTPSAVESPAVATAAAVTAPTEAVGPATPEAQPSTTEPAASTALQTAASSTAIAPAPTASVAAPTGTPLDAEPVSAPTSSVSEVAPPAVAPVSSIATAPDHSVSSASDADEPIVLPTQGFGRGQWIAAGAVFAVLVGVAVVIGFRRGSNDAQHVAPTVASAPPAHLEPPAPTQPVAPVAEPIAPAAIAAAPVLPTPTPTVAVREPTPTAPPRPTSIATARPAAPAPPVVNPPTLPTRPVASRTIPTTATPATTTSPTNAHPTRDAHGGLRPRPTTGHGYVPDDI